MGGGNESAKRALESLSQLTQAMDRVGESSGKTSPIGPATNPDDDCLESYLQNYMQKLTGKNAQAVSPTESAATQSLLAVTQALPVPPVAVVEQPVRQPTQAPECRSQLAAMRDVAIDSARRAVQESSQIQKILGMRRAYRQARISIFASAAAMLAFFLTHTPLARTGSLLLFALAVFLCTRFALLFRNAMAADA